MRRSAHVSDRVYEIATLLQNPAHFGIEIPMRGHLALLHFESSEQSNETMRALMIFLQECDRVVEDRLAVVALDYAVEGPHDQVLQNYESYFSRSKVMQEIESGLRTLLSDIRTSLFKSI